jgi:hypothetical protein
VCPSNNSGPCTAVRHILIGLFVGPVILAVLLALWREWTAAIAE